MPLLVAAVLAWSAFTMATPLAADLGMGPLLACRVALGLGEGVSFPACHHLIARLVAAPQQSKSVGAVTAASYAGVVLANYLTPLIIAGAGWPAAFYAFGMAGFLWAAAAAYFYVAAGCWREPALGPRAAPLHRRLDVAADVAMQALDVGTGVDTGVGTGVGVDAGADADAGADLGAGGLGLEECGGPGPALDLALDDNGGADEGEGGGRGGDGGEGEGVPWAALLRAPQVWAIVANQFCQGWGFYVLLNWIPAYYEEELGVDVDGMGAYLVLPYLVQGAVGLSSGWLADALLARGMRPVACRRLFQLPGMLLPAAFLLALAYLRVSPVAAMLLLTGSLGANALTIGGVSAYQLDFAPRHAAIVFSIGNATATLAGIVGVYATGVMLLLPGAWFAVFWFAVALFVAGAVLWLLLARGHDGPLASLGGALPAPPSRAA